MGMIIMRNFRSFNDTIRARQFWICWRRFIWDLAWRL